MRSVLILTYYWPPAGGPGVQRWVKMSNHLLEMGYQPIVITVAEGSYPAIDESLLAEVNPAIKVVHTATREPFSLFNRIRGQRSKEASVGMIGLSDKRSILQRLAVWIRANVFIPDGRMGWRPYAYKAAQKAIAEHDIQTIITTGPPHSTHEVGRKLQSRHGLKWIADFRDPWVNVYYHDQMPLTKRSWAKHQQLENETLKKADAITVVSPGMNREFADRAQRISTIFNGYDTQDFTLDKTRPSNKKFTLRYTGNLKPNQDVPALWQALSELSEELPGLSTSMSLELIGKKDPRILKMNQDRLGSELLVSVEAISHTAAVEAMCSADMLLFIIPQAKNNTLILTGKLFEYLASARPILSIGPEAGDAAEILQHSGRQAMLDYADKEGIKSAVKSAYHAWQEKSLEAQSGDAHCRYSRRAQTQVLVNLIEQLNG